MKGTKLFVILAVITCSLILPLRSFGMCNLFRDSPHMHDLKENFFRTNFVSLKDLGKRWGQGVYQSRFTIKPSPKNPIEERAVSVYLPPQYFKEPKKKFRILLAFDGQNTWDDPDCGLGGWHGWQLNLQAEALIEKQIIEPIIIVAIPHGSERFDEDLPPPDPKGKGQEFVNYIINDIMPFLNQNLRIQDGAENIAILGSSLGGNLAFWIGMDFPHIFGIAGVFSPALWALAIPDSLRDEERQGNREALEKYELSEKDLESRLYPYIKEPQGKLYIYVGGVRNPQHRDESDGTDLTLEMIARLQATTWGNNGYFHRAWVEGAGHNEVSWSEAFDGFARTHFPGPRVNDSFRYTHTKRKKSSSYVNVQ